MRFLIYGYGWASDSHDPIDILRKYVGSCEPLFIESNDRVAPYYVIDIAPTELMNICSQKEFDVLLTGWSDEHQAKIMAFYGLSSKFRQR